MCGRASAQPLEEAEPSGEIKLACVDAASSGQLERDAGRLLEAREQMLACARDACPAIVRRTCVQWLDELEPRIPSIVLRIRDDSHRDITDARANIDGAAIALDGRPNPVNPGKRQLTVLVPNRAPIEQTLLVLESEGVRLVSIDLPSPVVAAPPPSPESAPPNRETGFKVPAGAWILAAAGGASLAVFGGFAIAAKSEYDDLKHDCAPRCTDADKSRFETHRLIADVALGVGAAAVFGAAVWTVLPQPTEPTPAPRISASLLPIHQGACGVLTTHF